MKNDAVSRIRQNKLWDFPGGIHPPEMKSQSNQTPIKRLPLPSHFYVPVVQHSGSAGDLSVKEGDKVLKGQPLTQGENFRQLPVHSPTSGRVIAIGEHISTNINASPELTVVIQADGEDKWCERCPITDYTQYDSGTIIDKIYQKGVAGLGGAVFSTSSKLHYADTRCELLIINGAECEPYITCDDRLMQDYTAEMIEGIEILQYVLQPQEVVIAIEDNKPNAIKAVRSALKNAKNIQLRVIPTKYPSGSSDQLVQVLTGLEIPQSKRTIEMGIVMHNVGTAYAVKRAVIDDEALIERVVTLTGNRIGQKGNVWARLGTPLNYLLEQVQFEESKCFPVLIGGPLMGFSVPTLQVPVTKTVNCVIAPNVDEYSDEELERNCIRCSICSDACPIGLLPQQLYWHSRAKDHDKAKAYNLDACIECGICAFVCPSNIPLVQYFRDEKAEIAEIERKEKQALEAKQRFEAREARLQKEKEAREKRIQEAADKRREQISKQQGEDPVQAALARLKSKKEQAQKVEIKAIKTTIAGEPDNSELMALRKARRLAKQQQAVTSEQQFAKNETSQTEQDPRKLAVAQALARAKAKKEAQQKEQQAVTSEQQSAKTGTTQTEQDPRKLAVAQAIARAKAKKEAQQKEQQAVTSEQQFATTDTAKTEQDPRKLAVAQAIARAKAKKEAQQNNQKEDNNV
ncbi:MULTISPECIES: electron transport complex subunit RsxC [Pasteurellaceae]|uniref:Ion-translocating oxidoreductase complex subunit C n=1 Tax=Pasteurella atlantica TaxID=2827233 RepID=A0AAW8CLB2_9PAST|nr:electron transport complex subunit RsxC [Pasteurella atlantica]MBR0573029.1 electron transport complex subunit RsxC [Pasteurella atlantica]MDP8038844.1 electron transport complex subunit RsxC [Pasteurella atlantica]MDP8041047.1 electron transport complex subunit RsxC [Pasteurella atlantica]MDP8043183.1 electron transport complex subunit RsxC [Pasteurella atlantica]MDP8045269.1 electron transport complex subunit RsxC [Pasteurella atlantica]